MRHQVEIIVLNALQAAIDSGEFALATLPSAAVERPRDASHGDWATTVALRLAKELKRSPKEIATVIAAHIQQDEDIAAVEVAGAGFVNLRLSERALQRIIQNAREQGSAYGAGTIGLHDGVPKTVNVEFISANPTGPMHVGHGRWAALGNALCNVLEHAGWQVTREFYINDAGVQMDLFGASIVVRYQQLCGLECALEENHYAGTYVTDIAQSILEQDGRRWLDCDTEKRLVHFREFGYARMLAQMKEICVALNVPFDVWYSERDLYQPLPNPDAEAPSCPDAEASSQSPIEALLALLKEKGLLYEKEGATWFETTQFGDDKDRVLVKADGSYTYFAPDIAYHLSKFERGSEFLINIWGADHHGYIPRMQAACTALGHEGKLSIVLGQLVNLFRGGEAVRMSKRTGELVTFEELIEEVGADATKYLMLARSSDQPIDFDIELAKKQDSSNPVYYVQYAHARICSLLRKAAEQGYLSGTSGAPSDLARADGAKSAQLSSANTTALAPANTAILDEADLSLLTHPSELDLARALALLGEIVEGCARDLAPFRLTHYAEELATAFHRFYTDCHIVSDNRKLSLARLYLCDATRSVLALTLGLLGVSAPDRM